MPNLTLDSESMEKVINSLTKIGSGFIIIGGSALLLSIYVDNLIGLKTGVVTLTFGAIFRLINLVWKYVTKCEYGDIMRKILIFVWFTTLLITIIYYFYILNSVIDIASVHLPFLL